MYVTDRRTGRWLCYLLNAPSSSRSFLYQTIVLQEEWNTLWSTVAVGLHGSERHYHRKLGITLHARRFAHQSSALLACRTVQTQWHWQNQFGRLTLRLHVDAKPSHYDWSLSLQCRTSEAQSTFYTSPSSCVLLFRPSVTPAVGLLQDRYTYFFLLNIFSRHSLVVVLLSGRLGVVFTLVFVWQCCHRLFAAYLRCHNYSRCALRLILHIPM